MKVVMPRGSSSYHIYPKEVIDEISRREISTLDVFLKKRGMDNAHFPEI
ncbi:hypothetical protein [Pedobacter sp. Bi36]|nr:hypothetical protein [Pedobacter sp. Bi36]CAH0264633.1 hypothetical protein SRABI36_03563 [Pedobacter sp. Bi36]CAH0291166.1 hypothetical protein SRABI126_04057 [Pedobacter sp. Bi126]